MGRIILKKHSDKRILLIGYPTEERMSIHRYRIKKVMEDEVEFIYTGLATKVNRTITERIVDAHPKVSTPCKKERFRDYNKLTKRRILSAKKSLRSALTHYKQLFDYTPHYILIIQVK